MPNNLFRELTSIARDYVDEYTANSLIVDCCRAAGTSPDDVTSEHISALILNISTDVTLVEKLEHLRDVPCPATHKLLAGRDVLSCSNCSNG